METLKGSVSRTSTLGLGGNGSDRCDAGDTLACRVRPTYRSESYYWLLKIEQASHEKYTKKSDRHDRSRHSD